MARARRSCLVVVGALGRGGAERQAVLTAHALEAAGVAARLFVCRPPLKLLEDARSLGVEVDAPGAGAPVAAQVRRLRGALRDVAPDGVVTFLPGAGARHALATLLAGRRPRPRWIHSVRRNQTVSDWLGGPLQSALRAACLRAADRVVANSAALAANTIATAPYAAGKLEIVPNVLLDERGDAAAARRGLAAIPGLAGGGPLVGAIGSVREERNHVLLAQAFAAVRRAHPGARLVIIGRTDTPDCRGPLSRLRATCAALHLEDAVILPGEIPAARRLAPGLDAFVVSSTLEGSSNALAEAIVAGAAVATTPVADAAEIVGDAGAVATGWTPEALAAAILRVLAGGPAYRAAGERQRAQLLAARSPQAVGARWAALLDPPASR